jgi:hypothetical protein
MHRRLFAIAAAAVVPIAAATLASTPAFAGGGGGPCTGNGPVIGESPVGASGQMTSYDGHDAAVGWQNFAADGSSTALFIDASRTLAGESQVVLFYQQFAADNEITSFNVGYASSTSFSVATNLSSAHLEAAGTLPSITGGPAVNINASVSWVANGASNASPQNGTTTQSTQGQTIVRHLDATCQPAQATGVVTIPGSSNLATGNEYISEIDHIQSFTLTTS